MKKFQIREYIKKRPDIYKVIKIPDEITEEFCSFLEETFNCKVKKSHRKDHSYLIGYWDEEQCFLVPSCYLLISSRMDIFVKNEAELKADYMWYFPTY